MLFTKTQQLQGIWQSFYCCFSLETFTGVGIAIALCRNTSAICSLVSLSTCPATSASHNRFEYTHTPYSYTIPIPIARRVRIHSPAGQKMRIFIHITRVLPFPMSRDFKVLFLRFLFLFPSLFSLFLFVSICSTHSCFSFTFSFFRIWWHISGIASCWYFALFLVLQLGQLVFHLRSCLAKNVSVGKCSEDNKFRTSARLNRLDIYFIK